MYVGHVGDSAVVIGKQSRKHFESKLVAQCVTVVSVFTFSYDLHCPNKNGPLCLCWYAELQVLINSGRQR